MSTRRSGRRKLIVTSLALLCAIAVSKTVVSASVPQGNGLSQHPNGVNNGNGSVFSTTSMKKKMHNKKTASQPAVEAVDLLAQEETKAKAQLEQSKTHFSNMQKEADKIRQQFTEIQTKERMATDDLKRLDNVYKKDAEQLKKALKEYDSLQAELKQYNSINASDSTLQKAQEKVKETLSNSEKARDALQKAEKSLEQAKEALATLKKKRNMVLTAAGDDDDDDADVDGYDEDTKENVSTTSNASATVTTTTMSKEEEKSSTTSVDTTPATEMQEVDKTEATPVEASEKSAENAEKTTENAEKTTENSSSTQPESKSEDEAEPKSEPQPQPVDTELLEAEKNLSEAQASVDKAKIAYDAATKEHAVAQEDLDDALKNSLEEEEVITELNDELKRQKTQIDKLQMNVEQLTRDKSTKDTDLASISTELRAKRTELDKATGTTNTARDKVYQAQTSLDKITSKIRSRAQAKAAEERQKLKREKRAADLAAKKAAEDAARLEYAVKVVLGFFGLFTLIFGVIFVLKRLLRDSVMGDDTTQVKYAPVGTVDQDGDLEDIDIELGTGKTNTKTKTTTMNKPPQNTTKTPKQGHKQPKSTPSMSSQQNAPVPGPSTSNTNGDEVVDFGIDFDQNDLDEGLDTFDHDDEFSDQFSHQHQHQHQHQTQSAGISLNSLHYASPVQLQVNSVSMNVPMNNVSIMTPNVSNPASVPLSNTSLAGSAPLQPFKTHATLSQHHIQSIPQLAKPPGDLVSKPLATLPSPQAVGVQKKAEKSEKVEKVEKVDNPETQDDNDLWLNELGLDVLPTPSVTQHIPLPVSSVKSNDQHVVNMQDFNSFGIIQKPAENQTSNAPTPSMKKEVESNLKPQSVPVSVPTSASAPTPTSGSAQIVPPKLSSHGTFGEISKANVFDVSLTSPSKPTLSFDYDVSQINFDGIPVGLSGSATAMNASANQSGASLVDTINAKSTPSTHVDDFGIADWDIDQNNDTLTLSQNKSTLEMGFDLDWE